MILNDSQKIYLGDRSINKIIFDTQANKISILFDCASIFETEYWIPGKSIDINDCAVDFFDVKRYSVTPTGFIPNDFIVNIKISTSKLSLITLGECYNEERGELEVIEGCIFIEFGRYHINYSPNLGQF